LTNLWIRGLAGAAPTSGLRLEVNSGTAPSNNTDFNVYINITIDQAPVGLRMASSTSGGTTDNWFFATTMHGIATTGISLVNNCDSNNWHSVIIQMNANNSNGVVFNDSATPNADTGVYDERIYGISFDCGAFTGCYPLVFNY